MRAIIWVPSGNDAERWKRVCVDYCERRGYDIVSVIYVQSDGLAEWRQLAAMADEYEVLVVGRQDHLPAQRSPRVEVVADAGQPPWRRRPRRLPRRSRGEIG